MTGLESGASGYRWAILAVTVLAQVASAAANQGIPPLVPFYQADLHLVKVQIGLLNSAVAVGLMAGLLAAGWVADLVGTRRVILAGLVALGAAVAAVSTASSFTHALPLMLLAGVASSIAGPAIAKSIVVWFPTRERGLAMGVQRSGVPLMGALAAAILPSFALALGWRSALVALGAATALAGLIVFALYRESPSASQGPSLPGVRPGSPWKLLRNRNILVASVLPVALVAVQFSLVYYLVVYCMESLGAPVVVAGGMLALAQVGGMAGRIFWGVVSDRLFRGGRRDVLLLVGSLSFLLLSVMALLPPGVPLWTVTLMAMALGMLTLGWHGVYTILLPELAGRESAASAVGLGYTLLQIGAITGPPLFGYLVDLTGDYRWGWGFLAVAVALGSALLLLVREPGGTHIATTPAPGLRAGSGSGQRRPRQG